MKVTDFGLARALAAAAVEEEAAPARSGGLLARLARLVKGPSESGSAGPAAFEAGRLTRTGTCAGTPAYAAPEQWQDAKRANLHSDVYSFWVMLFQMLTGSLPFAGRTLQELRERHGPHPPLRLPAEVPAPVAHRLDEVVGTCLARDPALRYADFAALREPLAELYTELTRDPAPPPPDKATQALVAPSRDSVRAGGAASWRIRARASGRRNPGRGQGRGG